VKGEYRDSEFIGCSICRRNRFIEHRLNYGCAFCKRIKGILGDKNEQANSGGIPSMEKACGGSD
jgi:hypothetical protein